MANQILVFTDELLKRVFLGLGELPSKVSHQVILELEAQVKLAESDVKRYVELIKEHLAPHEAKIPAPPAPVVLPPDVPQVLTPGISDALEGK